MLATMILMVFAACKKNVITPLPISSPAGMANLKIVHESNYAISYLVQLKVNDVRVSNNLIYNTPFPGGGLNTVGSNQPLYLALTPGSAKITISMPKAGTNTDSVVLFNGNVTIAADQFYSAYVTDTGVNTKLVFVTDNHTPVDSVNRSRYKFVNLMPNVAALDLYYNNVLVAGNILYQNSSPEFFLVSGTSATWAIRPAGALPTSTALASYANIIPNMRALTIFSRGYSGATGTRVPGVSLVYNY